MGGAGGSQGKVEFPPYIDAWMEDLLTDSSGNPGIFRSLSGLIGDAVTENPYDDTFTDFENPESYIDFGQAGMSYPGNYYNNALQVVAEDTDPEEEVENRVTRGENLMDSILSDVDSIKSPTTISDEADTQGSAIAEAADGSGEIAADIVPSSEWSTYLESANSGLDGALEDIDVQALANAAQSGSVEQVLKVIENSSPGIDHESVGEGILDTSKQVADKAGMLEEINWQSVFNKAKSAASSEVTAAVTKATEVVDSEPVEDAIEEYRRRIEDEYQNRVGAFSAAMADINAVNGSAYAIGLALIHAEHEQNVARYDTQLSLQLFQQALELHQSSLQSAIQSKLQAEITNKQAREEFISAVSELVTNVYGQARQLQSVFARIQQQGYSSRLNAESQAAGQEKQSHDQLLQQGAEAMVQLKQLRNQYKQFIAGVMADYAQTYTQFELQREQLTYQRQASAVELAHQVEGQYWNQVMAERQDMFNQLMSNTASFFEAHNAYISSKLKKGAQKGQWELDMWEKGANILAAPSGMARSIPREDTSKAGGAIGGALSGAGTGASIGKRVGGKKGTVIGAAAGGILGGAAGFLGA